MSEKKMNILNDGGKYFFFNSLTIDERLEPKVYLFNFDDKGNCWLEDAESFKFPDKLYDVSDDLRHMIKVAFNTYKTNLGVLLSGNKGQGKSLTAKLICTDLDQPVILITKAIPKEVNFVKFLNNIKQDYTLYVDEFEKLFKSINNNDNPYHSQETFLSFMDGVLTNEHKVLFLLTANESVNEYLINRPSRIKFLVEYSELPEDLFHLIVDDRLINKDFKEDLMDNVSLVNLNIDLLISIINDINLFNKPFSEFKDVYNYKFEQYRYEVYTIENGKETFDFFYNASRKIKYSDSSVRYDSVKQFLKFTKDEIVYQTTKWVEDKNNPDGDEIEVVVTKKVIQVRYGQRLSDSTI